MTKEDLARYAAGETEELAPAPDTNDAPGSDASIEDMTDSPAGESGTAHKQNVPLPPTLDDDIDSADVRVVPGTGGPDDGGDVDVDPEDLNVPGRP